MGATLKLNYNLLIKIRQRRLVLILPVLMLFLIPSAYADQRPALCYEDATDMCGLKSGNPADFFAATLAPLDAQVEGYGLMILWGGILAMLWFKTENIMLMGIVGIIVAATITGLSEDAKGIGMLLLAISIGILLFQMIRQRVSLFN